MLDEVDEIKGNGKGEKKVNKIKPLKDENMLTDLENVDNKNDGNLVSGNHRNIFSNQSVLPTSDETNMNLFT